MSESDEYDPGRAGSNDVADKVHVLHPGRPPSADPHHQQNSTSTRAMRRLLAEWMQMVKRGELSSIVLVGGLAADGRTVDSYATTEDPLTTLGRLRQVEHMILSSNDDEGGST